MSAEDKLNKLFESARSAEPEVELASIEKLVENKINNNSHFKKIIKPKFVITMSVLIVICTSVFLFFNNSNQEVNQLEQPATRLVQSEKSTSSTAQIAGVEKGFSFNMDKLAISQNKAALSLSKVQTPIILEPIVKVSEQIENSILSIDTNLAYRAINISTIKVIELTNEELKNLGISVNDKKIKIPIGDDRSRKSVLNKEGATFEFKINFVQSGFDSIFKNIPISKRSKMPVSNSPATFGKDVYSAASFTLIDLGDTSNKLEDGKPIPHYSLITDDLGQKWRVYEVEDGLTEEDKKYMRDNNLSPFKWEKAVNGRKEGERKLIEKVPSFIPVLVRSGDTNLVEDESFYRADIIIWFEPSEVLFNALPKRISSDLRKEYQSVFVNKMGDAKSCKYFEACQNTPGAIDYFSAFPNPTDGELTVEFNLSDKRTLEANIYSINGMLLKKALLSKSFEIGKHRFDTNIGDLLPGVYLLVIESDKGDIISKRIVRR